jgi:hypothetical protein
MGLFSKSKESADLKQAQEIKEVSTEHSNPSMPSNLPDLNMSEQPQLNQNNSNNDDYNQQSTFNNPFSQDNQTTARQQEQPMPAPIPNQIQTSQPQLNLNEQNPIQQNQMQQPIQATQQNHPIQPQNPPITDLMPQIKTEQTLQPQQNSIFNTNFQATEQNQQQSSLPSDLGNNNNQGQTNQIQNTPQQANIVPQEKQHFTRDSIQEIVDETVEQVIEERWQQIIVKIEKVAQWKDKQEQHINLIKEDILTMKESFEKLEKRIINKVSDYDRNILDVNSEIKALEKVFQKITPTLVNNVNELSNIAKIFKADSKTENIE